MQVTDTCLCHALRDRRGVVTGVMPLVTCEIQTEDRKRAACNAVSAGNADGAQ